VNGAPLPRAWLPSIGGLVCDFVSSSAPDENRSAWPSESRDHGITRFPDGQWMVMLPMGSGIGPTLPDALLEARAVQHDALRAEREQAIADATREYYEAQARRLGSIRVTPEGDLVLLREPASDGGAL
jgi:hypothetical protein